MTYTARKAPLAIPIAGLLPPQSVLTPGQSLPSPSSATIGPLPSSSAIHLGLSFLAVADLPEYPQEAPLSPIEAGSRFRDRKGKGRGRVLIVAGPKGESHDEIEEEDEDWLRASGGDLATLHMLRRIDIRYCKTIQHVLLLLTLLSTPAEGDSPQSLPHPPALIILWNLGYLLMEDREEDENLPLEEARPAPADSKSRFKAGITSADYLNVIAAARSAAEHFSSLNPESPLVQLIVLEPQMSPSASLPILPATNSESGSGAGAGALVSNGMSRSNREKRIEVRTGLKWLLGDEAVGTIEPLPSTESQEKSFASHSLSFPGYPGETFLMRRRRCPRGEWASAAALELDDKGVPKVEGDQGGWRWEWV